MSQTKKLKSIVIALFLLFAFFAFGCEKGKVAVNNIEVKLENQSQVVLLVDEFFNLGDCVEVSPNYATDKTYSIYSMNENVVRVVGKQIKAISVGETMIRVVSNSDENVEDVISVVVQNTQTQLNVPTNLKYNETSQTFAFNPVDNAASYTININEREYNIGNVNTFDLSNYVGEKYNNVLTVKVKANASSYGKAYSDSEYGNVLKVYQTHKIEDVQINSGKLTYSTNEDLVYDVYFDDTLFIENTSLSEINLLNLDRSFAGKTKKVTVVAKPSEATKLNMGSGVLCVSSKSNEIILNVINEPTDVKMVGNVISWDAVPFVGGYDIYVSGVKVQETEENLFDLQNWAGFETANGEIEVKVASRLPENSKNLTKTNKQNEIVKFSRLTAPIISMASNGVKWNNVENASAYFVQVKKDNIVEFEASTTQTSFDFSNFDAGNYSIEVHAIGNNGVNNYISSKTSSITITKHAKLNASITDYVLKIQSIVNEKYKVEFVIDDKNTYSKEITATSQFIDIDLSTYNFKKGLHNIDIIQLGNISNNTIDGETKTISFTQLEAATVSISKSVASVTRSKTNENAEIFIEISGSQLAENLKVKADSYEINTIDSAKAYLSAGAYSVVAYVKGNGSSLFSYRGETGTGVDAVACGQANFTVLDIPSLSVQDFAKAEVLVNKVNYATKYSIMNFSEQELAEVSDADSCKYSFELGSGEIKQFKVRAIGNESSTLSSLSSNAITVERLKTPELSFDSADNSFDITKNNDDKLIKNYRFYHENNVKEYTFGNAYSALTVGVNKFKINLESKGEIEGTNYINSLDHEIVVRKLSNLLNVSINNNNELDIINSQNANLKLKFDFYGNECLLENGKIVIGENTLNYIISSNKYTITLLDSNYKAIVSEMAEGFAIQAKFLRNDNVTEDGIKVYYTDSDWSEESAELKLKTLETTTDIYTNADNKIIIENPNSEQHYLDITIDVEGTEVEFKDNGLNKLVNGEIILSYSYLGNKYYIELFDDDANVLLSNLNQGEDLCVKVKFKKSISGTDIDSAYSTEKTIKYLIAPTFTRYEQTLSFKSTYEGYGLDKYNVIVNNSLTITMASFESLLTVSTEGGLNKYTINMSDLWSMFGSGATNINSLKIEILNSASSTEIPLLSAIGTEIHVQQAQTFDVYTEKDGGLTNVKVNWVVSDYAKTYSLDVQGYKDYTKSINVNLDELTFAGELKIEGFVKANSSYENNGKTIEVFNSEMSNSVVVTRLSAPTLSVKDNKIYYLISGTNDYEVYLLSGGNYTKVDADRLLKNADSFMFNDLSETAEFSVKIKATTTNKSILDSNLSDAITVVKLGTAYAAVVDGNVRIYLPDGCADLVKTGNVSAQLALNLAGNVYSCQFAYDSTDQIFKTDVNGIVWSNSYNAFTVNPGLIFDYSDDYIEDKQLRIALLLNGLHDNKNYIYSDEWVTQADNGVKALFAPENIEVKKSDNGDYADTITWKNNTKNKLSNDGELLKIDQYVFAFNYEGKTYYSTDAGLKYLSGGSYLSYGLISATTENLAFPYGYDADNNGSFADDGDVIFTNGLYKIRFAAVKDGYVTSPYSDECQFEILGMTSLSIKDGKLKWDEVIGATGYVVRIKDQSSVLKHKVELDVSNLDALIYDFEDCDLSNDLFLVSVQAITKNTDKLNSKESEPLKVFRLPAASKVEFADGMLKITASPFTSNIDIEYNGKTYRYSNPDQKSNLTDAIIGGIFTGILDSIKDAEDVVYLLDISKDFPELVNASGEVKVRLVGNTGTVSEMNGIDVDTVNNLGLGDVGLVNSKTTNNTKTTVVLNTNVNTVSSGVWKFDKNSELGSAEKVKINYNFNDVNTDKIHPFWLDTIVYKIDIKTRDQGDEKLDVIYAVDYDRFIAAISAEVNPLTTDENAQTYYEFISDKNDLYARIVYKYESSLDLDKYLYFNVYCKVTEKEGGTKDYNGNIIDLQNNDTLFYYPIVQNGLSYEYKAKEGTLTAYETINLAAGGSFIVNIRTLGGDISEELDYSYLNSPNVEQTFVRFGMSNVQTINGELAFDDLTIQGTVPVYKICFKLLNDPDGNAQPLYAYLYDEDKEDKESVQTHFGLTDDAVIVPIRIVGSKVLFDLSKYFNIQGAYIASIQALAGSEGNDYLLNAKLPTSEYERAIQILTAPKPTLESGNLVFKLSEYQNENTDTVYNKQYEVTIVKDGVEYSQKMSETDMIIKGTKLIYIIPNKIGDLEVASSNTSGYDLKVRAITNVSGLINSTFIDQNADGEHDYIHFERKPIVSDAKIENGILKWKKQEDENYLIKVYDNNNRETILIGNGFNQLVYETSGGYCEYDFAEKEYSILGKETKVQIKPDISYTISLSRTGNNLNLISSVYKEIAEVYRIGNVLPNEIVAENGLLTWTQINDATGYYLEMVATNSTYKYTIEENVDSIDLSTTKSDGETILPAGDYKAKIRAITTNENKLNSLMVESVLDFTKLGDVDDREVKIEDGFISWAVVDGAYKYEAKFDYTPNDGSEKIDEPEEYITYRDENGNTRIKISAPKNVAGGLKISIVALGNSELILKSNICECTVFKDAPKPVSELSYNDTLNRFEWKPAIIESTGEEDFNNTDKFIVVYDFVQYSETGNLASVRVEKEIQYQQSGYYDSQQNIYYLPISVMGEYNNFTVIVRRNGGDVASSKSIGKELNLFAYGDGSEETPYALSSEQNLKNIKYYKNSNYKLIEDINIVNTYNSAIVDVEFAGYIYGNNKSIKLGSLGLTDVTEFAVFKKLNGATIYNLTISGNITNIITQEVSEEVKVAFLAVESLNAILSNVTISGSIELLNGNDSAVINNNLYLSGLFAIDANSTLTNCITELSISSEVKVDNQKDSYIGSVAAKANSTHIIKDGGTEGNDISLTVGEMTGVIKYLGGIFGYYSSDSNGDLNKGVEGVKVYIKIDNAKAAYIGGVVGYAEYVYINSVNILGEIKYEVSDNSDIYLGGIAGFVNKAGIVTNNQVGANINISIDAALNNQLFGGVVGQFSHTDTSKESKLMEDSTFGNSASYVNTVNGQIVLTLGLYGACNIAVTNA